MNEKVLLGLISVILILAEIIKYQIMKRASMLTSQEKQQLQQLYDWHDKHDVDGTKIWYVPRSWASMQERIADACRTIAEQMRRQSEVMQKMDSRLEFHSAEARELVAGVKERLDSRDRRD